MSGLYALKPWYARRLRPVADRLERHDISPDAVSAGGVAFGALAGAALALLSPGPLAGVIVAVLLAARLACANLDGTLARRRRARPSGGVVNEAGDRLADLAMLAGLTVPLGWPAALVLLAATLPSWAALAVAAQGGSRSNAGPLGKTERCALMVVAASSGWFVPVVVLVVIGSVLTALLRLVRGARSLDAEPVR
jgi:CDP-diacylglycerol--glycerol-3-phosphate 3-phosphatidyltransferase